MTELRSDAAMLRRLPILESSDDDRGVRYAARPTTRIECGEQRPCPYVSCRYHLFLDVAENGSIILNTKQDITEMEHSCSLDVADEGEASRDAVAGMIGVSHERVRQIEEAALRRLERSPEARTMRGER